MDILETAPWKPEAEYACAQYEMPKRASQGYSKAHRLSTKRDYKRLFTVKEGCTQQQHKGMGLVVYIHYASTMRVSLVV